MSYSDIILADNPKYFWKADTQFGDDTLVDSAGINDLVLQGANGVDYIGGVDAIVRDLLTATQVVAGQGSVGGLILDNPIGDFSFEFWFIDLAGPLLDAGAFSWLYTFTKDIGGHAIQLYLVNNGTNIQILADYNDSSRVDVMNIGSSPSLLNRPTPQYIVFTYDASSGDAQVFLNGTQVDGVPGTAQLGFSDGYSSLFQDQTAPGVPDTSDGAVLRASGVALYPSVLTFNQIQSHYIAGDIFPTLDIEPAPSQLDVHEYWTVSVNPGSGSIVQTNIVADYDGTDLSVYATGLGWGDGWEGVISSVGGQIIYTFRRSLSHPRDAVTIFAAVTGATGYSVSKSVAYTLCGFTAYPAGMDPYYEKLIDAAGCPVGCD